MLNYRTVNIVFWVVFAGIIICVVKSILPLYSVLIVGAIWLGITIYGSTSIQFDYFYPSLHRSTSKRNEIALTFDDGPTPQTLKILALLKTYDVKASFFCIGHKVDENPDILRKIVADGHIVGNHTYAHPKNFGFLSSKTVLRELESCDRAIKQVIGKKSFLFRSPFGISNPKIKKALGQSRHQPIGWGIRSFDALFNSEEMIYKRIANRVKAGEIILLHDTKEHTLPILERLLILLKEKKLKPVTLEKLLDIQAYR